jgi:hypothetical protein
MLRLFLSLSVLGLMLGCAHTPSSSSPPPFADIHLHYSWRHEEVTNAQAAVEKLKKNNVVLASVSSEPSAFALKMTDAGGDWIIPFASPYYQPGSRASWYYDKNMLTEMRKLLETGRYGGIGEVHVTSGGRPRLDSPQFIGLIELAREFELPFLIHTNAGNYHFFESICKRHNDIRFIWAHAGGELQPDQLEPLMQSCSNVWLDLTARDPWHYGHLTETDGTLLPGWRDLIIRYQDRVMTGTDPVWNAHQSYRWYESDEGWDHYDQLIQFHRDWMKQLPDDVEEKVRLSNALMFFGRERH